MTTISIIILVILIAIWGDWDLRRTYRHDPDRLRRTMKGVR